MRVFYIKGKNLFTDNEGKSVEYQINKLVLGNEQGNTIEIKLDKMTKKLLPFMFYLSPTDERYVDETGAECEVYRLSEDQPKSITIE